MLGKQKFSREPAQFRRLRLVVQVERRKTIHQHNVLYVPLGRQSPFSVVA